MKNKNKIKRRMNSVYATFVKLGITILFLVIAFIYYKHYSNANNILNEKGLTSNKMEVPKENEKSKSEKIIEQVMDEQNKDNKENKNNKDNKVLGTISNPYSDTELSEAEIEKLVEKLPKTLKEKVKKYPESLATTLRYFDVKDKNIDKSIKKDYENGQALDRNVKLNYICQWDERWGFEKVGDGYISVSGCGPTTLSMIYSSLTGDTSLNPIEMAKKMSDSGYYIGGEGGTYGLFTKGPQQLGLNSREIVKSKKSLKKVLDEGKIVVALVRQYGIGDFTKGSGHYIVLTEYDKDEKLTIYDVNSYENTNKKWDMDRVISQTHVLFAIWK